jgi:hypothetical protein
MKQSTINQKTKWYYNPLDINFNKIHPFYKHFNTNYPIFNIARRVFGNSVQASYFEHFHWSILNFWTLQTAEHAVPCSVAIMLPRSKIQNWPMKTCKITSLHRVQSVRTCSEYTNTRRDKEIRVVTAPDR